MALGTHLGIGHTTMSHQAPAMSDLRQRDLTDPHTHQLPDMAEYWRDRRAQSPIFWHDTPAGRPGFWVVAGFELAFAFYRDRHRFTAERGNVLLTLLAGGDSAAGRMLAVTDSPRHDQLRALMRTALTTGAVQQFAPRLQRRIRHLLEDRQDGPGFDFAAEVASDIPIATICELLGLPDSIRESLVALTKQALSSDNATQPEIAATAARQEIILCLLDQVSYQRLHPQRGLITDLIQQDLNGVPLSDDQIVTNCYSLILGGDETTRLTLVNAVAAFAADPSLWTTFRQVENLGAAVEEVIRCFAPTMHFGRVALEAIQFPTFRIEPGQIVTLWNISANRDETRFAEPEIIHFDRNPNPHLSFGAGTHFCLGAHLARLEIGIVLNELRKHTTEIVATGHARPLYSNFLRGWATLPVALR